MSTLGLFPRAGRGLSRALLRRGCDAAGRARDLFPLTRLGIVALALAALAFGYYGKRRLDLLLLVVGAASLALFALAIFVTVIAAAALALHLRGLRMRAGVDTPRAAHDDRAPLELVGAVPAETGFSLPALRFLPLVRVEWSWVEPPAEVTTRSEQGRLVEIVTPLRRARGDAILRRVEVSDAFGLTRLAFGAREPREVRVAPSAGALARVHLVRSTAEGEDLYDPKGRPEGERIDTRAYAAGDPTRLILWKVYARTQKLVVRTPERAYSVAKKTVAYLVAGDGDEPAAGAARVAVESGALGDSFAFAADGVDLIATKGAEALDAIARSAACSGHPVGGVGLAPFLARVEEGASSRAVVFVPARPGPWLGPVVAAARARAFRAPLAVVVCTDGIDPEARLSRLSRLALLTPPTRGPARTPAAVIAEVVRALGAGGARVVVVDRQSGKAWEGARLAAVSAAAPTAPAETESPLAASAPRAKPPAAPLSPEGA
jgi:Protein of unknown function DUF58